MKKKPSYDPVHTNVGQLSSTLFEVFSVKTASEHFKFKDLQFTYQIMISYFRLLSKMGLYLRLVSLFILSSKQLLPRILLGIFSNHIHC